MNTVITPLTITNNDVESCYSGKNGRCCCGCSGNHRYNSQFVNEATMRRGYAITPDEINDRQITRVLNVIKQAFSKNPDSVEVNLSETWGDHFSLVDGERLYIVYLRKI